MSDNTKTNAAGVPLLLVATGSGNALAVDYSQVPVTAFDPAEVATVDPTEAQTRMDALVAKYDGVECKMDEGTTASGAHATETLDEDQYTMGADWPLVNALTARGADRVLAHQHLAAAKAAAAPPAAAPASGTSEQQPAAIAQTTDGASGGNGSSTDAPPAAEPPALVLTKDQHEQTRSLLQDIEAGVHWIDDKAKVAYAKLVALLHHV